MGPTVNSNSTSELPANRRTTCVAQGANVCRASHTTGPAAEVVSTATGPEGTGNASVPLGRKMYAPEHWSLSPVWSSVWFPVEELYHAKVCVSAMAVPAASA